MDNLQPNSLIDGLCNTPLTEKIANSQCWRELVKTSQTQEEKESQLCMSVAVLCTD